jgi:hypothetical protein
MYQHVLGACEAGASKRENVHQLRWARAHRKQNGGPLEAALSAVQVSERADMNPAQILDRLASTAPKTTRGRARTPSLVRNHAKLAVDGPCSRPGNSAISSTSSIYAICGCTVST